MLEGNAAIPIFREGTVSFTAGSAVKIILQAREAEICSEQPIGCSSSMTFLVDVSKLQDRDDIRADDLGVWDNKGVKSTFCSIVMQGDSVKNVAVLDYKPSMKSSNVYRLKRTYWVHSEDKRISRRLFELEGVYHNVQVLTKVITHSLATCIHFVLIGITLGMS